MRSYISDFNAKFGIETDKFDLALAQAGVSNGRNERFLNMLENGDGFSGKGKSMNSDLVDIILTQSPEYPALYKNTMQRVRDAEDAVDRVIVIATERFNISQAALDVMISRAAELPDGTKVARSEKDGLVYTLDGMLIDQDEVAQIEWTGREDSLEDIQAAQDRVEADFEVLTGARQDEVRLGEIREEMEIEPDADRVKDLGEEAEAIQKRNEAHIIDDPSLNSNGKSFDVAASDISVPSL